MCILSLLCSALRSGRLTSLSYVHEFPCSLASLWVQQKIGGQKGIQVKVITSLLPPSLAMVWQWLHCSLEVLMSLSKTVLSHLAALLYMTQQLLLKEAGFYLQGSNLGGTKSPPAHSSPLPQDPELPLLPKRKDIFYI